MKPHVRSLFAVALAMVACGREVKNTGAFADSSPCALFGGGTAASGYGSYIDVSAPFWSYSTAPGNTYEDETDGWCGNSFAAPHVAGTAALIRSKWPSMTNVSVRERVRTTAVDLGAAGYDNYYGHGRVDAARALGPWADIGGYLTVKPSQTCTWTKGATFGGSGSLSYSWQKNGVTVGSGTSYTTAIGASGRFQLKLTATDGQSIADSKTVTVTISSGGVTCPE